MSGKTWVQTLNFYINPLPVSDADFFTYSSWSIQYSFSNLLERKSWGVFPKHIQP